MRKNIVAVMALAASLLACQHQTFQQEPLQKMSPPASVAAVDDTSFTNPIIPNGADPWLQFYQGNYYLTTTTWTSQLVMRKSPTLAGLSTATPINIWSESEADRCCNFWAFEFHRLMTDHGYRWFVMYTSGTKDNFDGQHLSVIESEGDDPMGPYTYKGSPMPKSWNIDGTYLQLNNQLYLLWSEWQKDEQLLWIAKMSNPWTITGEKKIISHPTHDWEKVGMKVNEGPEVLQKDGKTFITFSASFCNTQDYKLGVMELSGNDPMADNAWHKFDKPFFEKANGVFGPGHNGFFKSPDGTEDWLVYHGNSSAEQGCGQTRALRAQKFNWHRVDGELLPDFGAPIASGEKVKSPSGENGPLVTTVQGAKVQLVNKAAQSCLSASLESGQQKLTQVSCASDAANWTLDYTSNGKYRLANAQGLFLSQQENATLVLVPWSNKAAQQWKINAALKAPEEQSAWLNIVNDADQKNLAPITCGNAKVEDCLAWRIQPVGEVAIVSTQSGKVVTLAASETNSPAKTKSAINAITKIEQDEWKKLPAQRWQFKPTYNALYAIQNTNKDCLQVAGNSIVPGAALTTGACGQKSAQWSVNFAVNGTVKIINTQSNLVLDLSSCGVANHTALAQAPTMNTECQQFRLLPVGQ